MARSPCPCRRSLRFRRLGEGAHSCWTRCLEPVILPPTVDQGGGREQTVEESRGQRLIRQQRASLAQRWGTAQHERSLCRALGHLLTRTLAIGHFRKPSTTDAPPPIACGDPLHLNDRRQART